jgi:hypothetical protein
MEVQVKLVHLVALVVTAAFGLGLLVGRYALPEQHKSALDTLVEQAQSPANRKASNESAAQAKVRAAVPGMEAYNADHNVGYAGVTLEHLQASYDAGIRDVAIIEATPSTYCIESTVGDATYHKAGPAGDILSGSCP